MKPEQKAWINAQLDALIKKKYTQDMTPQEQIKGGLSAMPIIGDAISGYDAYHAAKKGNYGESALNAAGLLPFIPGMAGIIKNSKATPNVANNIGDIENYLDSMGVKHSIIENKNSIQLNKIVVPENNRNSGLGTEAMNKLSSYADYNKKLLTLTPSSDFGGNKKRLVDFYKRFGFVENKGKNRDFSTMDSMVRIPK
jgi:hypothetical protein